MLIRCSLDTSALFDSNAYQNLKWDNESTIAAILQRAQAYKSYTYCDDKFHGLPRFDNLTVYDGIDDEQEDTLIETEVKRLLQYIQEHNQRDSLIDLKEHLGPIASRDAMEDFATIVDELLANISICEFDMTTMVVKQLAPHRNKDRAVEIVVERCLVSARRSSRSLIREYVGNENIVPRLPLQLHIAQDRHDLYIVVLEYFTALLTRYLVNAAEGKAWVHRCLGVLARMTAKLRQISYDAPRYAKHSFNVAGDILSELEYEQEVERASGGKLEAISFKRKQTSSGSPQMYIDIVDHTTPAIIYYLEELCLRNQMAMLMRRLLDGFSQKKRVSHWEPFSFEVNTIIRAATQTDETGEIPLFLIMDDRHRIISVSEQSTLQRICYPACQLRLYNLLEVKNRGTQGIQPNDSERQQLVG